MIGYVKTGLPVLRVQKNLENYYYYLGGGEEGYVWGFDSSKAFKIFFNKNIIKRRLKLRKVELLSQFDDPSFTFPIGWIEYADSKRPEGYYMNRVQTHEQYPNFLKFMLCEDGECKKKVLTAGDRAIRRAHKRGLTLGDIHGGNILIDNNMNPVFIDTDNYAGFGLDYDLKPDRSTWLSHKYKWRFFSQEDNDKFLYAIQALQVLIGKDRIGERSKDFYQELIMRLDVSQAVKNGLLEIFSDMKNKPYVGDVLEDIDPHVKILSFKNVVDLHLY